MKTGSITSLALAATLLTASIAAQEMPDIGFKSVGRGRPLAASVYDLQEVGPNWIRQRGQRYDPAHPFPLNGYRADALPKNYKPLPRDIFTSDDFYKDKALWSDPRYFRCNSQQATEYQRGILQPPGVEHRQGRGRAVGTLRASASARGHREPVRLQDGAGALRGAAEGDAEPRRPEQVHVRELPGRRVERRVRAPGPRRGHPDELVLGQAHADPDDPLAADAGVPAADGAGGVSPDARQRALALDVLLARRLHAALVPGGRVGALRDRHAGSRADARRRCAQLHAGHLRRPQIQHGGREERRRSAPRRRPCRAGTARRSASGTRTC